jgi:hypothetical protein
VQQIANHLTPNLLIGQPLFGGNLPPKMPLGGAPRLEWAALKQPPPAAGLALVGWHPNEWVAPTIPPMRTREAHEGEYVGFGVLHEGGELGETRAELVRDRQAVASAAASS